MLFISSLTVCIYIEPLPLGDGAGLAEMINSSGNAAIACVRRIVISHTIPSTIVSLHPFIFNKLSVYCIVCIAIHGEQSRTSVNITAIFIGAHKFIIFKLIAVSGCGNGGAPIDDGVANFTEGPAGVAVLCAGSRLVVKGSFGMNMPTIFTIISRFVFFIFRLIEIALGLIFLRI